MIEHEDGCSLATERAYNGIEGGLIHIIDGCGAKQPVSELIERSVNLFGSFPLRDVPRDLRRAHNGAGGIDDRRYHQRYFYPPPVFALAYGLILVNALSAPDASKYVFL